MRSCGILMHISSLSSPYGIGTFGAEAEKFADWLKEAGQKYWQGLPIGPLPAVFLLRGESTAHRP